MPLAYRIGEEPLPGFRLKRFLGDGTFGAVWQAVAPGGTEVAIKFIDLRNSHGGKELKSLQLIKRIRHPNLVPLLGYWLKDEHGHLIDAMRDTHVFDSSITDTDPGAESSDKHASLSSTVMPTTTPQPVPVELIVVMGLGDMSLYDRLRHVQETGELGIEANELLAYMEDAARGIDFLNATRHTLHEQTVSIQHCDIKPQNILIVGGAAQLCDLGLARIVDDTRSTRAAFTAAYGAPECFRGSNPSPWTDQYSLAISYVELRTGRLPFSDQSSPASVIQQHLDSRLDLSLLTVPEQLVIRKATSLLPTERYATAVAMVDDLRRAVASDDLSTLEAVRNSASRPNWRRTGLLTTAMVIVVVALVLLREDLSHLLTQAISLTRAPYTTSPDNAPTTEHDAEHVAERDAEEAVEQAVADAAPALPLDTAARVDTAPLAASPHASQLAPNHDLLTSADVASASTSLQTPQDLAAGLVDELRPEVQEQASDIPSHIEFPASWAEHLGQATRGSLAAASSLATTQHSAVRQATDSVNRLYAEGWLQLASRAVESRDEQEAERAIAQLLNRHPASARAYLLQGRLAAQRNALEPAIESYTAAIQLDRTLADAYALRGIARSLLNQIQVARADLSEALRLNPNDARSLRMRALLLMRLGMYAAAVADRDRLAELPVGAVTVILPLQVSGDAIEIPAADVNGQQVVLQNNYPLQLVAMDDKLLVVSFQFDNQRYQTRLTPRQVRPNAKF